MKRKSGSFDQTPKSLRYAVAAKLLKASSILVYQAISDCFYTGKDSSIEIICFLSGQVLAARVGLSRNQTDIISNGLVEMGFLRLSYRVQIGRKKGSTYEEFQVSAYQQKDVALNKAINRLKALRKAKVQCGKGVQKVFRPPLTEPTIESLGLKEYGNKCFRISAKLNSDPLPVFNDSQKTGTGAPIIQGEGPQENKDTPSHLTGSPPPCKQGHNYTKLNETKNELDQRELDPEGINNSSNTASLKSTTITDSLSFFPDSLMINELRETFNRVYQDLRNEKCPTSVLNQFQDDEFLEQFDIILRDVEAAGSTFEEWCENEHRRLGKHGRRPEPQFMVKRNSFSSLIYYRDNKRMIEDKNSKDSIMHLIAPYEVSMIPDAIEQDWCYIQARAIVNQLMTEKSRAEYEKYLQELNRSLTKNQYFKVHASHFNYLMLKNLYDGIDPINNGFKTIQDIAKSSDVIVANIDILQSSVKVVKDLYHSG